jgi:RHS repeat-associated protein
MLAAKEETISVFPSLAAGVSGGQKTHQGLAGSLSSTHQVFFVANSWTALGIAVKVRQNRVGLNCYGEEITGTGNDTYKFAQLYRDSDSGLDYAQARYYASGIGRFLTTDPSDQSGRTGLPQSWNRYPYALNDPANLMDPTGLFESDNGDCYWDDDEGMVCSGGGGGPSGVTGGSGTEGDPYILQEIVGVTFTSISTGNTGSDDYTYLFFSELWTSLQNPDNWTADEQRLLDCTAKQLGLKDIAAGVGIIGGLPLMSAPGKFLGATPGTSFFSSWLAGLLPMRTSPIWAPTASNIFATTPVVGRAIGRWIPIVSAAAIVWDAAKIGGCIATRGSQPAGTQAPVVHPAPRIPIKTNP